MANPALSHRAMSVSFAGGAIEAVLVDGKPCVAVRSVCEALGIDIDAQRRRIQRHPALSAVAVVTTATGADGKQYEMFCLPLDKLNGWLFGINAARVKPELRERLVRYQRECFDVLARHFGAKADTAAQRLRAQEEAATIATRVRQTLYRRLAAGQGVESERLLLDLYRTTDGQMQVLARTLGDGTVCGTPAELAKAVAAGQWTRRDVLLMLQACSELVMLDACRQLSTPTVAALE